MVLVVVNDFALNDAGLYDDLPSVTGDNVSITALAQYDKRHEIRDSKLSDRFKDMMETMSMNEKIDLSILQNTHKMVLCSDYLTQFKFIRLFQASSIEGFRKLLTYLRSFDKETVDTKTCGKVEIDLQLLDPIQLIKYQDILFGTMLVELFGDSKTKVQAVTASSKEDISKAYEF